MDTIARCCETDTESENKNISLGRRVGKKRILFSDEDIYLKKLGKRLRAGEEGNAIRNKRVSRARSS